MIIPSSKTVYLVTTAANTFTPYAIFSTAEKASDFAAAQHVPCSVISFRLDESGFPTAAPDPSSIDVI